MTLYEFNALELNERMEAVKQYGTFLDKYSNLFYSKILLS